MTTACAEHSLCITNTLDGRQVQDHLDAPEVETLVLDRLHHRPPTRHQGRPCDPCHERRWMLDWPQTGQGCTDAAHCTALRKLTQDCQSRLQCRQAEGPILSGTIPASARWESPRSCDHRRQHWEMDLFQRNSQWDCEGSPWSEDQNSWRLVRWEWRKDQRSHTCQEQVLHRVAEWPVLRLQAREIWGPPGQSPDWSSSNAGPVVAGQSNRSPTLRWHSTPRNFWPLCLGQRPTTIIRREDSHQGPGGSL